MYAKMICMGWVQGRGRVSLGSPAFAIDSIESVVVRGAHLEREPHCVVPLVLAHDGHVEFAAADLDGTKKLVEIEESKQNADHCGRMTLG